ncbi:hypothetical protein EJB05_44831, partial [Eragrostis curvula]
PPLVRGRVRVVVGAPVVAGVQRDLPARGARRREKRDGGRQLRVHLMTVFVYLLLPETKGVPIEQVAGVWREHWFWSRVLRPEEEGLAAGKIKSDDKHARALVGMVMSHAGIRCTVSSAARACSAVRTYSSYVQIEGPC